MAKPGAHALVWALPRTSHWTALALEDAGFVILDSIHHVFGSGFPKSLNVGRAIDSVDGVAMTREATLRWTGWLRSTGVTAAALNAATNSFMASHYLSANEQPAIPTPEMFEAMRPLLPPEIPAWVLELVAARSIGSVNVTKRAVTGERVAADFLNSRPVSVAAQGLDKVGRRVIQDTDAYTPEAQKWDGWGTALKPAHEVWWLARKPVDGSIAANVLQHGTGALNIDACRVAVREGDEVQPVFAGRKGAVAGETGKYGSSGDYWSEVNEAGRFPSNFLLTHSAACESHGPADVERWDCAPDCPVGEMNRQSGASVSAAGVQTITRATPSPSVRQGGGMGAVGAAFTFAGYGDSGGAARFFTVFRYEPKPSRGEKDEGCEALPAGRGGSETFDPEQRDGTGEERRPLRRNTHPTVKSVALMCWLAKLITPPGGTILDPFLGSGSTAVAAQRLGFDCIGCEREAEYVEIAAARVRGEQPLFAKVVVE